MDFPEERTVITSPLLTVIPEFAHNWEVLYYQ